MKSRKAFPVPKICTTLDHIGEPQKLPCAFGMRAGRYVHWTIKARNCIQLRLWSKCHLVAHNQNKPELVARILAPSYIILSIKQIFLLFIEYLMNPSNSHPKNIVVKLKYSSEERLHRNKGVSSEELGVQEFIKNKWLNLARRDPADISSSSVIYFCEDHFDLPNDMENYIQYRVMGSVSQVRMKSGCIPTKFECQPDRRKRTAFNITSKCRTQA
ncbi:hypothetical protein EVAR_101022_1 [Eumeta japonica]|uniref:THAP-type domain-containing protein n=1 Tax=Eumeta variegata TaxID=151549 RepID=A0A4C1SF01_EUMVA|nr:hypothetical protein EVAR_101022_1 [Eumeta japonica]